MTIFALNIMPYISASIIMQLMTAVVPSLESLKKEGEAGRKKINQYTRYLTVLITAGQAYGLPSAWRACIRRSGAAVIDPGLFFRLTTVITLVGGTMFLMWLGEQITARGIGNGISLIIFAGIVAQFPAFAGGDAGARPHRRAVGGVHHRPDRAGHRRRLLRRLRRTGAAADRRAVSEAPGRRAGHLAARAAICR